MSDLSRIPERQRLQLVRGLLPVGFVVVVAGVLVLVRGGSLGYVIVGLGLGLVGALVIGVGLGVRHSVTLDRNEAAVDAAIRDAVGPCGNDCSTACGTDTDCAVKSLPRH